MVFIARIWISLPEATLKQAKRMPVEEMNLHLKSFLSQMKSFWDNEGNF